MDPKDLPDFLGGEPVPAPEAAPVEAAAPEAPAAAAQPEPAPAEPAPAAPAPQPEPHHAVPLATFLDTRDKLSAVEKEARELREWRAQQEAAARRQPPPSRDEDPEGYEAFQASQIRGALYDQRLDMSRFMAEQRHGAQVTDEAFKWGLERCDADPHFNAKVATSRDPVGLVVAEWKRDQIASKVDPTEYEGYLAWKAAQAAAQPTDQPQPAAAQPAARPAAPRASLAAAPSAGSHAGPVPRDGAATFDAMFGN